MAGKIVFVLVWLLQVGFLLLLNVAQTEPGFVAESGGISENQFISWVLGFTVVTQGLGFVLSLLGSKGFVPKLGAILLVIGSFVLGFVGLPGIWVAATKLDELARSRLDELGAVEPSTRVSPDGLKLILKNSQWMIIVGAAISVIQTIGALAGASIGGGWGQLILLVGVTQYLNPVLHILPKGFISRNKAYAFNQLKRAELKDGKLEIELDDAGKPKTLKIPAKGLKDGEAQKALEALQIEMGASQASVFS